MPLLESLILFDVMQVVSPNDNRPLHLLTLHDSSQDSASDAYIASEGAFLVNISTLSSLC